MADQNMCEVVEKADEPANLGKVVHLLVLSFSWGMQIWVSFIAGFVLIRQVSRHTVGIVQSKLFPVYLYCLMVSHGISLTVYSIYHPENILEGQIGAQMALYFAALVLAALNALWLCPTVTTVMCHVRAVEAEHGLGNQIGRGDQAEAYDLLREHDPKYKACKLKFTVYHGMSNLCNVAGFICTTTNLVYAALNLSAI